jgi:type IV fimbrial biogenesis protein FimT
MEETGHAGFTLIELLITVALVALLAAAAVPAMSQFVDSSRLRGAAEQLVQDLRQARNRALTFQHTVFVAFATPAAGGWCYGWRDERGCDCRRTAPPSAACAGATAGAAPQRRFSSDFPRVSLGSPGDAAAFTLRFAAVRGSANAGTFRLRNRAGEVRVIVSPLGRVRACAVEGGRFSPC